MITRQRMPQSEADGARASGSPIRSRRALLAAALPFLFLAGCGGGSSDTEKNLFPVIYSVAVSERDSRIIITGKNFRKFDEKTSGVLPKQAIIGGVDVTDRVIWTDNQITMNNLPTSGAGSRGDIVLNNGIRPTNKVQLSEWRGKITITNKLQGSQMIVATYNVHWRASINAVLSSPGTTQGAQSVKDSTCTYDASGQDTVSDTTVTFSRAGDPNIPNTFLDPSNVDRFFLASITFGNAAKGSVINFDDYTIRINANATASSGINATYVSTLRPGSTNVLLGMGNVGNADTLRGYMDGDYSIKAGSWTSSDGKTIVSWDAMPVLSPPNLLNL